MNPQNFYEKQWTHDDISSLCQVVSCIADRDHEMHEPEACLWVVALDDYYSLLNCELVHVGPLDQSDITPAAVLGTALDKDADGIVLIYMDPDGQNASKRTLSTEETLLIYRLVQCGLIMNTPILDYLVVNETGYFSLRTAGTLEEWANHGPYTDLFSEQEEAD